MIKSSRSTERTIGGATYLEDGPPLAPYPPAGSIVT